MVFYILVLGVDSLNAVGKGKRYAPIPVDKTKKTILHGKFKGIITNNKAIKVTTN